MKIFSVLLLLLAFNCINRCPAGGQDRAPSTPVLDSDDNPKLDAEIVDALNKRYGAHPGFRSNHAKGVVVEGSFMPTPQAAELSKSPLFAGGELPVTVRFSDASGLPHLHDGAPLAGPYGMSLKFYLPNGGK